MADLPPDPNDMLSDVELIETLERVNDTAVETDDALKEGAAKEGHRVKCTRESFRRGRRLTLNAMPGTPRKRRGRKR